MTVIGNKTWKEPQLRSVACRACQVAVGIWAISQSCSRTGELGTRLGLVKGSQSWLFLPRFRHFSWISIPQVAVSLCLIYSIFKKLILIIFAGCLFFNCFYAGVNFHRSFLCCFCWHYQNQLLIAINVQTSIDPPNSCTCVQVSLYDLQRYPERLCFCFEIKQKANKVLNVPPSNSVVTLL